MGVVFRGIGLLAFVEMLIFIAVLLVGLAYVWAKGDLEWIRSIQQEIQGEREEMKPSWTGGAICYDY